MMLILSGDLNARTGTNFSKSQRADFNLRNLRYFLQVCSNSVLKNNFMNDCPFYFELT
jgi:hypothetical protein